MVFNQGPGRNIDFCLLTTSINIDPNHGSQARVWYNWLKQIITRRAELHFENDEIREIEDARVDAFLQKHSSRPRSIFQILWGFVQHNNGWTEDLLHDQIGNLPPPTEFIPNDGEFSLDWYESLEKGLQLFKNIDVGGLDVWVEQEAFYYSGERPRLNDGNIGDYWLANREGRLELWHKPSFNWVNLLDYIQTLTPTGDIVFSSSDPGNVDNRWWLDITGFDVRLYDSNTQTWGAPRPVTFSTTQPVGLSDGDLWIRPSFGQLILYEYDDTASIFNERKFSTYHVVQEGTNSDLVGDTGDNTFVFTCDDTALYGGPLSINLGGGDLEIRRSGTTIATLVDCLNFIGPDWNVNKGPDCVDIEHLPYTTLPEQGSNPSTASDAGRIFTKDVGGISELFFLDSNGQAVQVTNNGSTAQNVFLDVNTTTASAGQTAFVLPASAKGVITMKINGLDTHSFTFSGGTVTYNPASAGYAVRNGDDVTFLYYG